MLALLLVILPTSSSEELFDREKLIETSSICLDCHETQAASLAGSPHELSAEGEKAAPVAVGCIGCHDGWEVHIEDPSEDNIADLSMYSQFDLADVCGRCHVTSHQMAILADNPHNRTDVNCLSCHRIHDNSDAGLEIDNQQKYCLDCHLTVLPQFRRQSAHPLESGNIRCIDCHKIDETGDHLLTVGLDWSCQNCHSELAGPFVYEHPVVYDHLVDGAGCVECHEPHGSANDRLLKQFGNGTCLQCHSTPPGHRTNHSGLGTALACVDCHSDIHGSMDNRLFLDPELGQKLFPDCYQSGCHVFYR